MLHQPSRRRNQDVYLGGTTQESVGRGRGQSEMRTVKTRFPERTCLSSCLPVQLAPD